MWEVTAIAADEYLVTGTLRLALLLLHLRIPNPIEIEMSDSDVKSKRITATGSLSVGPARIRR